MSMRCPKCGTPDDLACHHDKPCESCQEITRLEAEVLKLRKMLTGAAKNCEQAELRAEQFKRQVGMVKEELNILAKASTMPTWASQRMFKTLAALAQTTEAEKYDGCSKSSDCSCMQGKPAQGKGE